MVVNQVILIGNLGADPEIRSLETGTRMARMRMATTERYTLQNGDQVAHTEWHSVVAWRELAKYAEQNLRCGAYIRVEGRLRSRETTDPITLNVVKSYEIIANSIQLLRNDAITTADEKKSPVEPPIPAPVDADSLPF